MKKYTNKYQILDTGTVISVENDSIFFELAHDLKIFFSFKDDSLLKENRLEFNLISKSELEIKLINFNNSLGAGNAKLLEVATLNNKKVFLNFFVYTHGPNSNKTLHYTWYSEK